MLSNANGYALPGWEPERLAQVQTLFDSYKAVDDDKLRENLVYFLKKLSRSAKTSGSKWRFIRTIRRIPFWSAADHKNRDDLDWLCRAVDSPANGITLCTGSIAEEPQNNVYQILAEFSQRGRIHFAHVRNIKIIKDKDFYESAHPTRYGSLDMYRVMQALHDNGFDGYIRPDHGRFIWGETGRPGYGLYDRALGATYLLGLWEALENQHA